MKHIYATAVVLAALVFSGTQASAINCVAYVQQVTNFNLMGNAWQWWYAAENTYERGYRPAPGAVMVFGRTARMHVGHVAVVRELRGPREIIIDQANWHHGQITEGVSVRDLSPDNDWSRVEVQWAGSTYGGSFPIMGFIYSPDGGSGSVRGSRSLAPHVMEARTTTGRGQIVLAGGRYGAAHHATIQLAASRGGSAHMIETHYNRVSVAASKAVAKCATGSKSAEKPVAAASPVKKAAAVGSHHVAGHGVS